MTLLEIERLVRKITDLLRQIGGAHIASKLAEDFANACHAANLRLQQCEVMIKANDRLQALQLAETAPNLLDVVTRLEFLQCDEWRGYCQSHALVVADRIDARAVTSLNECYGKGITTDHPLYAVYRRAVLSRNDEGALQSLQSIARLNPTDTNAATELARLDAKVLDARLERLGLLLDAAQVAPLLAEVEAIEAFGFQNQPDGEVWRKAQVIRCGQLLEQASNLEKSNDWIEALAKLDFIDRLKAEFELELPVAAERQIAVLGAWARGEQQKDSRERDFVRLLGDLNQRMDQSEEKDTSSRYVELPELRDDFEALHKVWRLLLDFTKAIPEDIAARFRKRAALLEGEIARRTGLRRRVIFASAAAALLVTLTLGWWVLRQARVRDFTAQLERAVAQRQVHAAEKLLERLQGQDQPLLSVGRVNTAAGEAEALVKRERALVTIFDANFARLPQRLDGEPDAARLAEITGQLAVTRKTLEALAPDLKAENEPRIQAFERQWQSYRAACASAINQRLEPWVSEAEERCQKLDYRASVQTSVAQMDALSSLLGKVDDCVAAFTNHLDLRGDLLERSAASRAKLAAYQREFKKLGDGMSMLGRARTLKDYYGGLQIIKSSEFSGSPEVLAASAIDTVNPNEQTALRALLGAFNAGTWAYLGAGQSSDFVPQAAMPVERTLFNELTADPAVGPEHWRYRFWLDPQGKQTVEWVTAGALQTSGGWQRIKAWVPSIFPDSARFQDREYGSFDGQLRLSPTQLVYRCEQLGNFSETGAFLSIGLEKVWAGGSSYSKPLLDVLDSLKASRDGSPLFRAYLFLKLAEVMNLQPDGWGVTFSPSLNADADRLRTIGGSKLQAGDWFVPAKEKLYGSKFEQFFVSIQRVSYAKQASGLLTVERAAVRDGLQYAGFIDLHGRPALVDPAAGGQLWAYALASRPAMLIRVDANSAGISEGAPMPLSPVFTLPNPPRQYLAEAGVTLDDPNFIGVLPPLFREPPPNHP